MFNYPLNAFGHVETFSGLPTEDVDDFLSKIDMLMSANQLTTNAKPVVLYSCLVGAARSWYETLDDAQRRDYRFLCEGLRHTFQPPGKQFHYFKQLVERKQQFGESVDAYSFSLKSLFRKSNPTMSEGEKVIYFIRGLQPHLQSHVITTGAATFDAALEAARKKEAALHQIGVFQDLPNHASNSNNNISNSSSSSSSAATSLLLIEDMGAKLDRLTKQVLALEARSNVCYATREEDFDGSEDQDERRKQNDEFRSGPESYNQGERKGGVLRQEQNWNRTWQPTKDFRTVGGQPICRLCHKVGHTAGSCWHRQKQQRTPRWLENQKNASQNARNNARRQQQPRPPTDGNSDSYSNFDNQQRPY
jgi:hypothetical protein